ncbi:ester cyclase (plasmid) [Legionella sp. D16C41]|uniref:ester cyclase n=1 Tax=Legionella sp. D16C41 TaxID=3402688 RepID=UPI003AF77A47
MNNLEIIKAYHSKIWDKKDLSAVKLFFDAEALIHSPVKTTKGTEQMTDVIARWHKGFPNLKVYWDDFICENDKVVSRWHAEGQQEGEFLDKAPSKVHVNYSGVTIYQLKEGKITQYWAIVDMDMLKKQLQG